MREPMDTLLEARHISKTFAGIAALVDVDFHLGTNEILGLLGDNGAGKSTFVKILSGHYPPDPGGELFWKEQKLEHWSVAQARAMGIEVVYQERALSEQQSLWRNIFMGRETCNRVGLLDIPSMRRETQELMRKAMGFTSLAITPDSEVSTFSGGERQGVAITRSLHFQADLIILDEPTMGLSLSETRKVLDFVANIKQAGRAALFIDHNIFHVFSSVDRLVVFDRGRVAGEFVKGEITLDDLIEWLQHVATTGTL